MGKHELVIFDGDDTLWYSEELYDHARDRAAAVVGASGLDRGEWSELQKQIDVDNIKSFGLSPLRFPASSRLAYEQLALRSGLAIDERVAELVEAESRSVFAAKARPVPRVAEVLRLIAERSRIALLTKGDREVQEKRIADSCLADLFDAIYIVDAKSAATFAGVATNFDLQPHLCLSVGNSLPSDITPALEAGMSAVWIDAHVWAHERRDFGDISEAVSTLDRLDDLPDLLMHD